MTTKPESPETARMRWLGKPEWKSVFGPCWIAQTQPNGKRVVLYGLADPTFAEFTLLGSDGGIETLAFDRADNVAFAEAFWPKHPHDALSPTPSPESAAEGEWYADLSTRILATAPQTEGACDAPVCDYIGGDMGPCGNALQGFDATEACEQIPGDDLDALERCAWAWVPEARLLGNVRAQTIRELCAELRVLRTRPSPEREEVHRLLDELIDKAGRQRHDNMPLPSKLLRNYVWNSLAPDLADAVVAAILTAAKKGGR
jgi:hypothetical protein